MNSTIRLLSLLALSTCSISLSHRAAAQGSLTPPAGPPAPVMKTLDQVEARIPLVAGQPGVGTSANSRLLITASGSYYLTGDLVVTAAGLHGIRITGPVNVTIDLNGFSVIGQNGTGSGYGIFPDGDNAGQVVRIRNGFVRGTTTTGFLFAIADDGFAPFPQVVVEDVHCLNVRNGIDMTTGLVRGSIVRNCSVVNCGGRAIKAHTVTDCTVDTCGGVGIAAWALVSNCSVMKATGTAIDGAAGATGSTVVTNSQGNSISGHGIVAGTVTASYGDAGGTNRAIWASTVNGCRARQASGNIAIEATIGIGCTVSTGTALITNKYNMP